MLKKSLLISIAFLSALPTAHALSVDELAGQFEQYKQQQESRFQQLNSQNQQLKNQNNHLKQQLDETQQHVTNNTVAVEVMADSVEGNTSSQSQWLNNTHIGGYGELHYQNRSTEGGKQHKEEIDFHRFVLFFEHEFQDNLRLFSELELEHSIAGDGKSGEIELEQAYLQYDFNDHSSAKAGLFLIPVGIMNETHEPATFYGVERNEVEKNIIPATWWEAGIGGNYRFDNGLSFDAIISTGLEMNNSYRIRSGRGKISKQAANNPIFAARAKYTGITGLDVATTLLHQTDLGQSESGTAIGSGTLFETHAVYDQPIGQGVFSTKALYSRWEMDINDPQHQAASTQKGWYIEPSYRHPTIIGDMGLYGRFQKLNYYNKSNKAYDIWETGLNWWLHENVILKANYIYKQDNLHANKDERGFDLGIGYQF